MYLEVIKTPIDGPLLLKPRVFNDKRGYFFESYSKQNLQHHNIDTEFIQDNQSLSHKGALRGMHFQKPPFAQAKLVRVITGKVLDVIVDIRKTSATYGKSYSLELSGENQVQLYIPVGFAHGFLTLEDNTIFVYKCSNYYNAASEGGLMWNDPALQIDWGTQFPVISDKDQKYCSFNDFNSPF